MFNIARRVRGWKRPAVPSIAAGAIVATLGSLAVYAQGTLPLPTPGTTPAPNTAPAPNPAAPGAPTTPPGDAAAKARAAALAAKANVDVTDAWTRATAGNATTAAIYLHLVSAKDPDRLIGLESAAAQKIEVHEDSTQNLHCYCDLSRSRFGRLAAGHWRPARFVESLRRHAAPHSGERVRPGD